MLKPSIDPSCLGTHLAFFSAPHIWFWRASLAYDLILPNHILFACGFTTFFAASHEAWNIANPPAASRASCSKPSSMQSANWAQGKLWRVEGFSMGKPFIHSKMNMSGMGHSATHVNKKMQQNQRGRTTNTAIANSVCMSGGDAWCEVGLGSKRMLQDGPSHRCTFHINMI